MYINWRLIKLNELNSCFQSKRLGKTKWIKANKIKSIPMILRWSSILYKSQYKESLWSAIENRHKWCEFSFSER